MRSALALGLVAALLPSPLRSQAPPSRTDAMLGMGIAQVRDGDFETAVFTLDEVVRRLEARSERQADPSPELARAYLYLGAAYVGLDHEAAARGKFRKALQHDPSLRPSPEDLPPKVIEAFEAEQVKVAASRSRHGRKVALLLGGVAGAGALAISAATSGTPNRPPVPDLTVSPEGQAIVGVTRMSFTANASDPDGDAVSYEWDLGDGATASGASVSHVYDREGRFLVAVTVNDGRGGSATGTTGVTVRSLSGFWAAGPNDEDVFDCIQTGDRVDCPGRPSNVHTLQVWVALADPRRVVDGEYHSFFDRAHFVFRCIGGEVQSDLMTIRCDTGSLPFHFSRRGP